MIEIHISVKEGFKRGIIMPALPGAIPSILLAIDGKHTPAYFLELLTFSTIYCALFLKKLWSYWAFWICIVAVSALDLVFIFGVGATERRFPFAVFAPFVILYCIGLVYGLRFLVSLISKVKVFFVE